MAKDRLNELKAVSFFLSFFDICFVHKANNFFKANDNGRREHTNGGVALIVQQLHVRLLRRDQRHQRKDKEHRAERGQGQQA